MEVLVGDTIGVLPFRGLKKVSDLVYFEGPILSHFRDAFGKDVLFYWVDFNEEVNRWLVFQIPEKEFSDYLVKKRTLFQLFENPINDIYYTVEIANKLEYQNVTQIFKGDLPSEYLPETNSFYSSTAPAAYSQLLNKYQLNYSKVIFMNQSLCLKVEPSNKKSGLNLVGIMDSADFLYGIGASFNGLVEYEATKQFVDRGIVDRKRINKATTGLVKAMQPNLIETVAASFAVAISPNSFTDVGERFLNKEWRDEIFNKFKNDVIDIDQRSSEDIDGLIKTYGENGSFEIYKPLLDLYNNKKIVIKITDQDFKVKRTIGRIKKEYVQKLTKREKEVLEPEERIAKVKYNAKTGRINASASATLFDASISPSWKTDEIRTELKNYKLRFPIVSDYQYEGKIHSIENSSLGIYASGESMPEAEANFYSEVDALLKSVMDVDNAKLSAEQIEKKRYLQFHINGHS